MTDPTGPGTSEPRGGEHDATAGPAAASPRPTPAQMFHGAPRRPLAVPPHTAVAAADASPVLSAGPALPSLASSADAAVPPAAVPAGPGTADHAARAAAATAPEPAAGSAVPPAGSAAAPLSPAGVFGDHAARAAAATAPGSTAGSAVPPAGSAVRPAIPPPSAGAAPAAQPLPGPAAAPGASVPVVPVVPVALAAAPAVPEAAPLPPVVETGHAVVDRALARLAAIGEVPAEARAGVYAEVHELLRDTLAGLEERPGQAPTPLNALGRS